MAYRALIQVPVRSIPAVPYFPSMNRPKSTIPEKTKYTSYPNWPKLTFIYFEFYTNIIIFYVDITPDTSFTVFLFLLHAERTTQKRGTKKVFFNVAPSYEQTSFQPPPMLCFSHPAIYTLQQAGNPAEGASYFFTIFKLCKDFLR